MCINKSLIIKSPSDHWYGITAQAGATPAQTQPVSLNSPIWPTGVKAKDTDRSSGWWPAKMKTALPMETPWPADSSPNFNDYIPLDVQWMTKNKDISTNHGVQGGLQVFWFFFSWRSKGTMRTGFLWYRHSHHRISPCYSIFLRFSCLYTHNKLTRNFVPPYLRIYIYLTTGLLFLKSRNSKNLLEIKE